jgi:hypothetical protein
VTLAAGVSGGLVPGTCHSLQKFSHCPHG